MNSTLNRRTTNLYTIQVQVPGISYRGLTELMGRLGNAVLAAGYSIDGSWASTIEESGYTSTRLPSDDTAAIALARTIRTAEAHKQPGIRVTVHTGLGVHRREISLEAPDA